MRVARALQLLVPHPDQESEFRATARLIFDQWNDIEGLAAEARAGYLSTRGMVSEEGGAIPSLLIEVAQTELLPHLAGAKARRYLGLLVVELALREPNLVSDRAFEDLARVIRLELQDLREDDAARAPIPDPTSLLALIDWVDRQPQKSERFPAYFWNSWRRVLRDAALRVVYAAADESAALDDDGGDVTEPVSFTLDPPSDAAYEEPSLIGLIPPEAESDPARRRSPGLQRAISEALLSTYTPVEALSDGSTTVLAGDEIKFVAADLLLEFDTSLGTGDLARAESALGCALILATGTSPAHIPQLRWAELTQAPTRPAGISTDARWLVRPELVPKGAVAAGSDAEQNLRSVWVPLPEGVRKRLLRLQTKPRAGALVLTALKGRPPSPSAHADHTTLRRTFFTRIARLEPLGISGAQWATGDDFGLDTAPLFYDRFPADALARLVESVTFPWFGERAAAARPVRPTHLLGSRVVVDQESLRRYFAGLRTAIPDATDLPSVIERLRSRTRNLVHGFAAATGHRPNDAVGEITPAQLDILEGIGIVQDKQVAPDWPHRPVALPASICAELRELMSDLKRVVDMAPESRVACAAKATIAGTGPILLRIDSIDQVAPYCRADYLGDVPEAIAIYPNFARHVLNQGLIGRVPEALRVSQLGWHGTREGAWAETSPWSVRSAVAELQKPIERHLAAIGWKPLQRSTKSPEDLPACSVSWVDQERERRCLFAKATTRLRKLHAERLREAAKGLLPALQTAIQAQWPRLTIDDRFTLKPVTAPLAEPIQVTLADTNRIESIVTPGDSRSQARAALRNALAVAFRRGRRDGLVLGAQPRRIHWRSSSSSRPSDFLWCAPLALRACRHLEAWIRDPATPISLSTRTALSLLLHGGYADISAITAAMHPATILGRTKAYPDVVLADARASIPQDGFPHRALAFHGMAALVLERWHRARGTEVFDLECIARELDKALPAGILPATEHTRLEEIAALARARNSLTMDGIARLVGTGVCRINSVSSDRIAAVYDGHALMRTAEQRDEEATHRPSDACVDEKSSEPRGAATVRTLLALLASVQTHRRSAKETDADARVRLRSSLAALLRNRHGVAKSVDLLARFAIALLDEGGERQQVLELVTIEGYVNLIAYSLSDLLGDHPLSRKAGDWQEAYLRIVATATPEMRHRKARALQRFHTVVSRFVPLPEIDLPSLGLLSGIPLVADAAALLSAAERSAVIDQLAQDATQLAAQGADAEEIHAARARQVYASTLSASSLRPGEGWSLTLGNVALSSVGASVSVSRHRWQRLKTMRSRRRIRLVGGEAPRAITELQGWVAEVRRRVGSVARDSLPIFGLIGDPETPIAFETFAARVGPLIRWATDNPEAVPYALRKTAIHEGLRLLQRLAPRSLWPLRDFLQRSAHGSFTTTISSYLHDPLVIFDRWFREDLGQVDSVALSAASGRSVSRISRANGHGSIHGGRAKDLRGRFAQLLDRVPYLMPTTGILHPAPPLRQKKWFLSSVDELDRVLRDLARGLDLREITTRRAWPDPAHAALERLLDHMAADLGVGFDTARIGVDVFVAPPRRLSKVLVSSKDDPSPAWRGITSEVLAQMGGSWLRHAALPGLPDGVPALASDWARWHQSVGADFSQMWTARKFGSLDCRVLPPPAGSELSAWPLFRWEVVLQWMAASMSSNATAGDGNQPQSG